MTAWLMMVVLGSTELRPVEMSVAAPRHRWQREIAVEGGTEMAPFDKGILLWQDNRFVMLAAADGRTVWDVNYANQDPPASVGTPQSIRFGDTLVFSQQRQGSKDYVVALTALDLKTGAYKWHRTYSTTVFDSEKIGDRLFTNLSGKLREVSLSDGHLLASIPEKEANTPVFPYGRPVSTLTWSDGFIGYYDYEDSEMYSGDMAGVHGLCYIRRIGDRWVDAWNGKWMSRMKGRIRNPKALPVWRNVVALDGLAWAPVTPSRMVGIDKAGNLTRDIKLSPGILPVLTSWGILYTSQNWIWTLANGKARKVRLLDPADDAFRDDGWAVTPIGLLGGKPVASNTPGAPRAIQISLTPIFPLQK